jgi:hypothetical protein
MKRKLRQSFLCPLLLLGSMMPIVATASVVDVATGQTSVLLDTEVLSSVGLDVSGISSDVIVPGNLGADSVAFAINSRYATAPLLPTTFSYTPGTLVPFSGTIEHVGSVFFNADSVEVGNFTIGYDASRVGVDTSGFFVESTVGVAAILFDVAAPSLLAPEESSLTIGADLLVSSEFANFLGNADLTGTDVGDALVEAGVPVPATLALLGLGIAGIGYRRRKQIKAE